MFPDLNGRGFLSGMGSVTADSVTTTGAITSGGTIDATGVITAPAGVVAPTNGTHTGAVVGTTVSALTYNGRHFGGGSQFLPAYAEWAAAVGWSPTWLTLGDEFGGNVKDRASTNDLTAVGTSVYDYVRAGYPGIRITANTTGFSANVNDFAATNSVFGAWVAVTDAVAAQRTVLGRYASTIYILVSIQSSGGGGVANKLHIQATDGTTVKTIAIDKVMTDGVPRLVSVHIDRTMSTLRARVSAPGEAAVSGTADITGWGTLTGGASPLFGYGYGPNVQNGDDCWMGGGYVRINADMTGANILANLHAALGVE